MSPMSPPPSQLVLPPIQLVPNPSHMVTPWTQGHGGRWSEKWWSWTCTCTCQVRVVESCSHDHLADNSSAIWSRWDSQFSTPSNASVTMIAPDHYYIINATFCLFLSFYNAGAQPATSTDVHSPLSWAPSSLVSADRLCLQCHDVCKFGAWVTFTFINNEQLVQLRGKSFYLLLFANM